MGTPSVSASTVQFSTTLPLGGGTAKFFMDTYFMSAETTVTVGNTSTLLKANSFYLMMGIFDWAFANANNRLVVGLKVNTVGADESSPSLESQDCSSKALDFGNMYFVSPTNAMYDGVDGGAVAVTSSSNNGVQGSVSVQYSFKSFSMRLVYDPTLGGGEAPGGKGCDTGNHEDVPKNTMLVPLIIGGALFVSVAAVAGFILKRRKATSPAVPEDV